MYAENDVNIWDQQKCPTHDFKQMRTLKMITFVDMLCDIES